MYRSEIQIQLTALCQLEANQGQEEKLCGVGLSCWSEASLEAGQLQLVDRSLVGEGGSGDATGWTSLFTQPHLPVGETHEINVTRYSLINHYKAVVGASEIAAATRNLRKFN